MKKLVLMFVFCLFSLLSYSQVITVHRNSIEYDVKDYYYYKFKLDTLKTIITSNPKIKYVNFFEGSAFRKSFKSKDIIKLDKETILKKIIRKRPKDFYTSGITYNSYYRNYGTSSSTSYYKDYNTGYTIESHTYSHGGNAIIRDQWKNNKHNKYELVIN